MTYFKPEELRCRCGHANCDAPAEASPTLLIALNRLRSLWGRPIVVTSGLRCKPWNTRVGGKPDSEHLTGEAADIECPDSSMRYELLRLVFRFDIVTRVGIGKTFLHLGVSQRLPAKVVWHYYPDK